MYTYVHVHNKVYILYYKSACTKSVVYMCTCMVPIIVVLFLRNLDKLTNLTTLNLSKTGVSYMLYMYMCHDYCVCVSIDSLSSPPPSQRDFTNTPHLDKLVHLTDIDMSYNDLTRSELHLKNHLQIPNTSTCI